jgi:hypothetical protein
LVLPGMTAGKGFHFFNSSHTCAISQRHPREFCVEVLSPQTSEGAGNAGRVSAPAASRANEKSTQA